MPLKPIALAVLLLAGVAIPAAAQLSTPVPFAAGERLTYRVRLAKSGTIGSAVMSVEGPVELRGTETLLARFATHLRIAFFKGSDSSLSWIDPTRMASLRFEKHEHRPFGSDNVAADIFPEQRRWIGAKGDSGATASDAPLDELSFIYLLRTLPLVPDTTFTFDRHYDVRRTPTVVRVLKRDTITTPAGAFHVVALEMHVKDAKNYNGDGVLRFWISDDACRLPVRIESAIPMVGEGMFTLESAVTPGCVGVSPTTSGGNSPEKFRVAPDVARRP